MPTPLATASILPSGDQASDHSSPRPNLVRAVSLLALAREIGSRLPVSISVACADCVGEGITSCPTLDRACAESIRLGTETTSSIRLTIRKLLTRSEERRVGKEC